MKRSEIKNKLASYLVKRDEHLSLNKEQALQLAHYVLNFVEKAGMLPPHIDDERYYDCYECGGDSVFKWENENE